LVIGCFRPDSLWSKRKGSGIRSDGRFAYLNPAAVRLLGAASPEALVGTPVLDRVHADFHDSVRQRIQRLNEDRQAVDRVLQQCFIRLDGAQVWVETVGQPIVYDGRNGALVFVRDISERKYAEAKQEKLQAQLLHAQKMEAVGRLAGGGCLCSRLCRPLRQDVVSGSSRMRQSATV
jgi:PAS domain S-box-containing protein